MNLDRSRKAFSLLELLTVVTIVGILSAIAVPTLSRAKIRASVAGAKHNITTLANAALLFRIDHGHYPRSYAYDTVDDLGVLHTGGSYTSATDYPDPFQRMAPAEEIEVDFDEGPITGSGRSRHGFVYVNYGDFLRPDIPGYDGIGIYSLGPDRRDSWLSLYPLPLETQQIIRRDMLKVYGEDALRPVVIYNPTNGVISDGDFGAFRGKFNGLVPKEL
jgi:prepilin-type N-terminal cleavage/methylation domain-containing protein